MLLILFTVLVPYQAEAALGLAEPQRDCSVDLRLMYTFMDDKFKMKDEIKQLKATLGELQDRLSIMEKKERPTYVPGPNIDISKDHKRVFQSSTWPTPPHLAIQAIDGDRNKYAHTKIESNAWWAMEFCNDVIIARVRLWNRVDCCDGQMANFVVTVDNEVCGSVVGAIGVGRSVDVTCPKPLIGKVLKVQRTDTSILSIAELQVFSSINTC